MNRLCSNGKREAWFHAAQLRHWHHNGSALYDAELKKEGIAFRALGDDGWQHPIASHDDRALCCRWGLKDWVLTGHRGPSPEST